MWIAYKTIVIKEILRFVRIWVQTIVPPVITTSLYLLIFGGLMGSRIGQMQGIEYIDFIVPGIILMTVIMQSYANTVSSFFMTKYNNSFEELLVSTTPNWIILLGFVSGGIARGFCVGLAVTFTISFLKSLCQELCFGKTATHKQAFQIQFCFENHDSPKSVFPKSIFSETAISKKEQYRFFQKAFFLQKNRGFENQF